MQPTKQNLAVVPGDTYRDIVRLMQPEFSYHDIASISAAPAVLDVPGHGLSGDWPVWIRQVTGLPAINREPPALPWLARWVDDGRLQLNLSATGLRPGGGQLLYRLPVDLAGSSAVWRFTDACGNELMTLTEGAGLTIDPAGTIHRELTPEQTQQLPGDWLYTFSVIAADGAITTYLQGGPERAGCCHGR